MKKAATQRTLYNDGMAIQVPFVNEVIFDKMNRCDRCGSCGEIYAGWRAFNLNWVHLGLYCDWCIDTPAKK